MTVAAVRANEPGPCVRIAGAGAPPPADRPDPRARGCGPMRWHWKIGEALRSALEGDGVMVQRGREAETGATVNLVRHRGIGLWLDVTAACRSAFLVVELLDKGRRSRHYAAPLDRSGRRWVEWPHGEQSLAAGFWYRYRTDAWSLGPDCSWFQANKWFDYDRIAEVRLMLLNIAPRHRVQATISSLCALREMDASLTGLRLECGAQSLAFGGTIPAGHYLVYEGGPAADVCDLNWRVVGRVPVRGKLILKKGLSMVTMSAAGHSEHPPWLVLRPRFLDRSFAVR